MGVIHKRKLSVKQGVSLFGVAPGLLRMAYAFMEACWDIAGVRAVITSAWDGRHGKNSYHDVGHGIDMRSKEIPTLKQKQEILARVKEQFPSPQYDILLEGIGGENEHFHGEENITPEEREVHVKRVFGGVG